MDLRLAYFSLRKMKEYLRDRDDVLLHERFIPTELETLDTVMSELKRIYPDIEKIRFIPTDSLQ